jgi:hypothetical protein
MASMAGRVIREKSSDAGEPHAGAEAGFYKREWRAVKKKTLQREAGEARGNGSRG